MAASTKAEEEEQVSLRLMVDKEKNRVLLAEVGKDFVDVLLSFLTLPLGTIARIVAKDSNMQPVRFGSLSSLHESVSNLDEKLFWTETCKEMLLQPRNSMEAYCKYLKLNIDDTEITKYFICEDWDCSRKSSGGIYSTFRNIRCRCGRLMNREISLHSSLINKKVLEGYVHETAAFTITDGLEVLPSNLQSSLVLLRNLGVEDMDAVAEMTVNISKKEVVDLLKCSLLSKMPLTDLFLKKKQFLENPELEVEGLSTFEISEQLEDDTKRITVKLTLRKSNGKILLAQGEEDFVNLLVSFLTFPLGVVEHMLGGNSGSCSLDNLYKSILDLDANRHLNSQELKNMLISPQVALQFKVQNQIFPIGEMSIPKYYCYSREQDHQGRRQSYLIDRNYCRVYSDEVYAPMTLWEPKSSLMGETSSGVGFVKGPSVYMVTDDLVVTPISFISASSFLHKSRISLCDLEERVLSIGVKEGLSILKTSLISSSALTNGLRPFINPIKKEFHHEF